jgi:hypothetical protein
MRFDTKKASLSVALLSFSGFLFVTSYQTSAATYYVRPEGGSPEQCNGCFDAPYAGQTASQDCAWDHRFRALSPDGVPRIDGGTLIVFPGHYMMGYGARDRGVRCRGRLGLPHAPHSKRYRSIHPHPPWLGMGLGLLHPTGIVGD